MQPNVRLAILAALALLLVACFSSPFQDDDAWWLLTTGQYIVHNHKLPVPDPFAFTTYIGKPEPTRNFQLTHQWLADAMLYLAYAAGGFPVVVWLRAVLMAAACGLAGLVARRRSGNFFAAVAAVLICAAIAYRFAGDQPAIVTFFGVAAAMAMAEDRRWRWAVPLLFLIWANCDDGFWLGWIALAFCCVEARRRQMWIVAALSVRRARSRCSSAAREGGSTKIILQPGMARRTCCAPCQSISSSTCLPAASLCSTSVRPVP